MKDIASMIEAFSQNMVDYRLERGMSQSDLARKTGLTQATISRIENLKQYPSMVDMLKICGAFGVAPGAMFR